MTLFFNVYQAIRHAFSRALLSLSPVIWRQVEKTELTALAGIHATFLSILMTGLTVYIVFVFTKVQEMEMRALAEAERVNDIRPVESLHGRIDQNEVFHKDKLINMLDDIMFCRNASSLPIDDDQRAKKALGIMRALTSQYPFPEKFFKTKEGNFASRGEPQPVLFGSLNDVREWVNTMDKLSTPLISSWEINMDCLPVLLDRYSRSELFIVNKKHLEKSHLLKNLRSEDGPAIYSRPESLDPILTYKSFFETLITARQIMKKTRYYVQQADMFRNKYPSKNILIFASLMICVSFIFGVIVPVSFQSVRSIIVIIIPFLFYLLIFVYLAFILIGYVISS